MLEKIFGGRDGELTIIGEVRKTYNNTIVKKLLVKSGNIDDYFKNDKLVQNERAGKEKRYANFTKEEKGRRRRKKQEDQFGILHRIEYGIAKANKEIMANSGKIEKFVKKVFGVALGPLAIKIMIYESR